jgi:hypothetical protein
LDTSHWSKFKIVIVVVAQHSFIVVVAWITVYCCWIGSMFSLHSGAEAVKLGDDKIEGKQNLLKPDLLEPDLMKLDLVAELAWIC